MSEAVSEAVQLNQSTIKLIMDDITDLEVDAFVYYTAPDLAIGSGFGTAIAVRGGPSIEKELKELAPLSVGDAVITEAGKMKAKHIIHAVGPRFQEEDTEGKLRTTMVNSLKKADENKIETLAFPAMGAGFYGVPIELCAQVMLETIKNHLKGETGIKEILICLFDSQWYKIFQSRLAKTN